MRLLSPFIRRRDAEGVHTVLRTPAMRNVRVPVQEERQQSPGRDVNGGAWGELRVRPSRVQVATAFHPDEYVSEERFIQHDVNFYHFAQTPPGRMAPVVHRANVKVPPHVAYGSLFEYAASPYGVG